MRLHYTLVDVFTNEKFGGNQLAVFSDARDIPTDLMQRIARELNLAETTFALPPDDPANDFQVRIFTPAKEMPMAGHPTVGTAYVLAREQRIDTSRAQVVIRLEERVGVIPVTVELDDGAPRSATMQQPLPQFGRVYEDRAAVAALLALDESDLAPNLPAQVVSTGVPYLCIPLKNLDAVRRAQVRVDLLESVVDDPEVDALYSFTLEVTRPGSTYHARMFAPEFGIAEDPATGSAAGPLGSYLVKHGVVRDNPARITGEQGFEIRRPSFIHVEIAHDSGDITRVRVGGECVYVGEGDLEV